MQFSLNRNVIYYYLEWSILSDLSSQVFADSLAWRSADSFTKSQ